MNNYTQEEQTGIIKMARDLTATILVEEDHLERLESESFKPIPGEPVKKQLPKPSKIEPQYPPVPKTDYKYSDFLKVYIKDIKHILMLMFLSLIFFIMSWVEYGKRCQEMNEELAKDPAYLKARAEAEKIAAEKQKAADDKYAEDQKKLDEQYANDKEHYDAVILPTYKKESDEWHSLQAKKIKIIENEIDLNKNTLENLYAETKLVSATYRELWILEWLYTDMSTSDHDIRYATELLDRDRQRLATEQSGNIVRNAINNMNNNMMSGFSAVYDAIEAGNDIQEATLRELSKTRRSINAASAAGYVQRKKTNEILGDFQEELNKRRK